MFNDEVYEVNRDEFKGLINSIKPSYCTTENYYYKNYQEVKIVSVNDQRHFASVKLYSNDGNTEVKYYIYELPRDDERRPTKPVQKITLKTREEVEAFFKLLSKIQEKKDD